MAPVDDFAERKQHAWIVEDEPLLSYKLMLLFVCLWGSQDWEGLTMG